MNLPTDLRRRAVRDDGGFTLSELLVVVVIIVVLSLVALVVFGNQKARADDAVTQQRVSSMGQFVTAALAEGTIGGAVNGDTGTVTAGFGALDTGGMVVYADASSSTTAPTFCISATSNSGRTYAYTSVTHAVYEGQAGVNCSGPATTIAAIAAAPGGGGSGASGSVAAAPTSAVSLAKGGLVYDAASAAWTYKLDWSASPAAEGVTGYKVYRVNPDSTGALLGIDPTSAAWTPVTTVAATSYTFTPGDLSGNVDTSAGSWKMFRVVPTNNVGDGPSSNQVVVSDGFRQGRGSWLACAVVATGKVRVVVQIPDTWHMTGPLTWRLTNTGGATLVSGSNGPGILTADVPSGTVLGNVYITAGDGTVYAFTGHGTGTTNYTTLYNSVNSSGIPNKRC